MVENAKFITILLIVLSMSNFVSSNDVRTMTQSQEDWSADIGEKLQCIRSMEWNHYYDDYEGHYGETHTNRWPYLSAETHPVVGNFSSWNDIPHPNETFYNEYTGENCSSIFDIVYYPPYEVWYGEGQPWFNFILPIRSPSFYENLLETLTQGPWNYSINPVYFEDSDPEPSYWGYNYSVSHEGYRYVASATYWISAGYLATDNYAGVIREATVHMFEESSGLPVHSRRLRCSPSGPEILSQTFYHSGEKNEYCYAGEYVEGESDNIISWVDIFYPKGFKSGFELYQNGARIYSIYNSVPDSYNYSVDGLTPGIYNFTLVVSDRATSNNASSFILTVLPSDIQERTLLVGGIGIIGLMGIGFYFGVFRKKKNKLQDM